MISFGLSCCLVDICMWLPLLSLCIFSKISHRGTQGLIRVYIFQYDRHSFAARVGRKGGLVLLFKPAGNYFLRLVLKHQMYSKIIHKSHLQIVCSFPFSFSYLRMPVMGVKGVCRAFLFILLKINVKMEDFASCIVHNHLHFVFI